MGLMRAEIYSGSCGAEGDGFNIRWTLDTETGNLVLEGSGKMKDYTYEDPAPWSGYSSSILSVKVNPGITHIGNEAFYGAHRSQSVETVSLPEGLKSIGSGAFSYCHNLTTINLPNSVIQLEDAFYGINPSDPLYNTTFFAYLPREYQGEYTIPDGISTIAQYAFSKCTQLTKVTLPNTLKIIDDDAFNKCTNLSDVTIPSSVDSIGTRAFDGCTSLTNMVIPDNVTKLGSAILNGCTGITKPIYNKDYFIYLPQQFIGTYTVPAGIKYIVDNALYFCKGLTSLTLPDGLLTIGEGAFSMCTGLQQISLPNSLISIGAGAFGYCNSLSSIYIPAKVQYIGELLTFAVNLVYDDNSMLPFIKTNFTQINVDPANPYFTSQDGVLYDKAMKKLIAYPAGKGDSFAIPNGVQEIGPFVFYGNMSLKNISIPSSVTKIEEWAFGYCANLTSLVLPSSLKEIGTCALAAMIGTKIITCEATIPPALLQPTISGDRGLGIYRYIDNGNYLDQTLYVPMGSLELYKKAEGWNEAPIILPIQATESAVTDLQAEPTDNSVTIEWPAVSEAAIYTIEIKKNGELICTLSFNEQGQLLSISFAAPSRHGNNQAHQAQQTATGWQYTISGLDPDTDYTYTVIAKKNESDTTPLFTKTISFKTTGSATTIDQITNDQLPITNKVLRDGQLFIIRGDNTYTITGQEVK